MSPSVFHAFLSTRSGFAGRAWPRRRLPRWWATVILAWLMLPGWAARVAAGDINLEIEPVWGDRPLVIDRADGPRSDGTVFTVTRLDLLLSDVALLKEDGQWLESRDWYAFVSAGRQKLRARLEGTPAKTFRKVRFSVGLPAAVNAADPNLYPPEHPLHPQENGLHWGWQGGYVFLALEGRVNRAGRTSGFSYHLGNPENRVWIEVPAEFQGDRHRTVRVKFDVARLFGGEEGIVPERDGTATHSRAGDPLVGRLKGRLEGAFSLAGLSTDAFQELKRATNAALARTDVGTPFPLRISARLPKVSMPPDNRPTEEGVALGERLFHETRLSKDNTLACAGCHQRERALADGARFSVGVEGRTGRRQAMPLFNLAWQKEFFWDGRVTGLRHQALRPIEDAHEMAETLDRAVAKLAQNSAYPAQFRRAFGDEGITAERVGLAIEQFLLTQISQDSKFDRAARGEAELTREEREGLRLFVTEHDPARGLRGADCFHCHGGNLFTSGAFANNGLDREFADPGRFAVTGQEADRGKFRVPSLRNVAVTAPYMHDGRFETLEQVVEHYDRGVQASPTLDPNLAKHPKLGLSLTEADKRALVAFLRTLTDETFLQPWPPAKSTSAQNLSRQ